MGKHLKRLRAEKAKVKLKSKLPKGQNITDTSFKVKKIQLAEQLPDHAGVPITFKHQTLQDCLNYLSHHNVTKQLDGIKGLKELFLSNIQVSRGLQLRQIITKVLECAVEDKESKVRRSAIKLLTEVFSSLPNEARCPYIELLNKQVQRALSNINSGVQKDALRLVDLLMTITDPADVSAKKPLINLLLRLLTITGDSAPPRSDVLRRLLIVIESVFPLPETKISASVEIPWTQRPGPLTDTYKGLADIPLGISPILSTSDSSIIETKTVIKLLVRTGVGVWTEMSSDDHTAEQVAELMSLLCRLVLRLYKYAAAESKELKNWFADTFRALVGRNLLSRFPFQMADDPAKKNRQLDFTDTTEKTATNWLETNVNLAVLYLYLQPKQDLLPKVLRLLPEFLKHRPVLPHLVDILDCLLKIRSEQNKTVAVVAEKCRLKPDPILMDWLHRVALEESYRSCLSLPEYQSWMRDLVSTGKQSEIIAVIAGRGTDSELLTTLRKAMPELIQNPDFDQNMLNALYWACPRKELVKAAKNAKPEVLQYLNGVMSY